ncbi:MAG: four helix bundle protein, partial [Candidatus Binatia bacterium]
KRKGQQQVSREIVSGEQGRVRSEQQRVVDEKPHRKLKLWQASMDFVVELYKELKNFPDYERFGLVAQLQRAAVSVPSNLAEGAARKNTKELLQFLYIARGSLSEIDTQLEIAFRVGHLEKPVYVRLSERLQEISKMLSGLIASIAKQT